jgi:hypothetical protein
VEDFFRYLASQNVAIISISNGSECIGSLDASLSENILLRTIADNLVPSKLRTQTLKGITTTINN